MNVTLSIDDEVLVRARQYAEQAGTSVNQLIRDYLIELTARDGRGPALDELEELWRTSPGSSGGHDWSRESLYDRPILH
jgi:hypothetical protein